jgi:hypothetical protein
MKVDNRYRLHGASSASSASINLFLDKFVLNSFLDNMAESGDIKLNYKEK